MGAYPNLGPAKGTQTATPGVIPWSAVPTGGNPLVGATIAAAKLNNPNGIQLPGNTPKNWLTADPFTGINMNRLQTDAPWLYDKISKYQAGQGQLGPTYQFLLGRLGRAMGADDVFTENDIRNAGLAPRVAGAAAWDQEKRSLMDNGALAGALDSGDFGRLLAVRGSQADLAAQEAAAAQMQGLQNYNEQFRLDETNSALADLQRWADNRRRLRMTDAGAGAIVAASQAQADAARRAGAYSALSGVLGAGSMLAGGWGKKA